MQTRLWILFFQRIATSSFNITGEQDNGMTRKSEFIVPITFPSSPLSDDVFFTVRHSRAIEGSLASQVVHTDTCEIV